MRRIKVYSPTLNVYYAAIARLEKTFAEFEHVCLSFSGGKDSSILLHLTGKVAKSLNRKFDVLYVDWEIQLTDTVNHVEEMLDLYHDVIEKQWWVALPLRTTNSTSTSAPEWTCWEVGATWVRDLPIGSLGTAFFPFWQQGMTYEEFMPKFTHWRAAGKPMAQLIGLRADESLHRYATITDPDVARYKDICWTVQDKTCTKCYPLYDWKVKDIWACVGKFNLKSNRTYELMQLAGIPLSRARICEPFGPEAIHSLWMYHVLEPALWSKMTQRITGCSTWKHSMKKASVKLDKPPAGTTWKQQCKRVLDMMPSKTALHYKTKLAVANAYVLKKTGAVIPDQADDDQSSVDNTSWRRIYKMIMKNDYWCKMLSFQPTSETTYDEYIKRNQALVQTLF